MRETLEHIRRGLRQRRTSPTARRIREERLTYLSAERLESLERCCRDVQRQGIPGIVIECGIALGGSAILLAGLLSDRPFHGYDVFGMIPPPGEQDDAESHERYEVIASGKSTGIAGDPYYGYQADLYDHVVQSFQRHGLEVGGRIQLHKGLFEETLHGEEPVALAHIDGDWYESVRLCLERITPRLSPGGMIVLDDYFDWPGCRRATDEHLAEHPELRVLRDSGHRVLVRS